MLGLGLSLTTGGVITPYYVVVANAFRDRVEADGGTVESMSCLKADLKVLNPIKPVPSAFDEDYQAILDRSTALGYTAPSAAQQTLQNTLVTDLKTAGVWSKLDLFYVFATDGDSDYATLNWKAPSSFQLTKTNSPTFTANQGFAQSGTAYLDSGFVLETDATNYTRDDAGVFVGFPTLGSANQSNSRPLGTSLTANYLDIRLDFNTSSPSNITWINSSTALLFPAYKVNNSILFINRTSSSAVNTRSADLANDLNYTHSGTAASSNLEAATLRLLKGRGGDYFEQTANIGIAAAGSSLTTTDMEAVEDAWYTNYFTSL